MYEKIKTITTIIKAMLKKSDDQTNIHKYSVAANITEYNIHIILSKLILAIHNVPNC